MARETVVIGIPMYAGMDLLDVTGPSEVFGNAAETLKHTVDLQVYLLAESNAPVTSRFGVTLFPQRAFHEMDQLDVLWVPGGIADSLNPVIQAGVYIEYLKKWSRNARVVCSVCEGALLLAAAGLLDGYRATTHWAFYRCLEAYPKVKVVQPKDDVFPRYVLDPAKPRPGARGIRLTGGGISSGVDEALRLVQLLFGTKAAEDVQVTIQYFPEPPVQGTIPKIPPCPLPVAPGTKKAAGSA
ncbi:DJ-1/PfpI family protein [Longimicrobium sp.]|uniref:DJ-1/PfpI family protein n=1 Tax=Longimicrobium sp. TaxID=2029185 RepID=UPI003B3A954F